MARVLCGYGTGEGQTASVAERIGDGIDADGHDVTLVHLEYPPTDLEPETYDGFVVGASVHAGSHQHYVERFVHDHRETLNRRPSAFFSVSLTAAHDAPDRRAPATTLLETFLEETGWNPDATLAVAGALKYSEYGVLKRVVMRLIAARASGDTDTTRDYEYTDWDEVDSFAREFSTLLGPASE
jgi:menaquinone-dependent protoporphyrinogen oxidase